VQSSAELNQQRTAQWETWATAIIAREIERERDVMIESTGAALSEYVGKKTGELREEIQQLRAELAELRTEFASAKAHVTGQVIDLRPITAGDAA
jgi:ribosomal protein L29